MEAKDLVSFLKGGFFWQFDSHRHHRHLSPQSSFFAELREVVRREDALRFDELIFQPSSILHRRLISETEEEEDDDVDERPVANEAAAAGGAGEVGRQTKSVIGSGTE